MLEALRRSSTPSVGRMRISMADLIVLGGCAAVEQAARNAASTSGALHPGRAPTHPTSRPTSRRSRSSNRLSTVSQLRRRPVSRVPAEHVFCRQGATARPDRPEMTVLVGGMRAG